MTARPTAYDVVFARIQDLITQRAEQLGDPDEVDRIVESEIEKFQRTLAVNGVTFAPFTNPDDVRSRILRDLGGYSALTDLLDVPDVEEVYGDGRDLMCRTTDGDTRAVATPANPHAVLNLIQRLVKDAGEQMDASKPRADGIRVILPNGRPGRLTASIAPRIDGIVSFTLRIPQKRNATLDDLVKLNSLTPAAADFLAVLMLAKRVKILVAGPPGAGKTTVLDALLRAVPARRKVIIAEENPELGAPLLKGEKWRTSRVEDLKDLLKSARTASPDLIVLGEMKGDEAYDLITAANLGTGLIAAVHADSASLAFDALATAASVVVPAMTHEALRAKFARLFDIVIYVDIDDDDGDFTMRQVTEISVVPNQISSVEVAVTPIFIRDDIGEEMRLAHKDVGEILTRKCDRVLRRRGRTLLQVLDGAGLP
jgi:pilus assembly protein CpaF